MKIKKKLLLSSEWRGQVVCPVSGSLALLFRLSQVCAVGPVKFEKQYSGQRVSLSPPMIRVGNVIMTLMNAIGLVGLVIDLQLPPEQGVRISPDATKKILWVGDYIMVMLIASLAAYGAPYRVKETLLCLSRMHKIKVALGDKLTEVKASKERNKCALLILFVTLAAFTVAVDYAYLINFILKARKTQGAVIVTCLYSSYEAAYIMLILLEAQFTFSVLEVNEVLKIVNNALESITQPVYSIVSPPKTFHGAIRDLAMTYNVISDVIKRLDDANGLSLVLLLASCLLHLVITPNYLIGSLTKPLAPARLLLSLCWASLHALRTVLIIEPPSQTMVQIQRTNLLVSRLMLQDRSVQASAELDKFCKYLLINKVTYSPMGVCTISRSLLTSMLATVATYLVIIIQFQKLDASNKVKT